MAKALRRKREEAAGTAVKPGDAADPQATPAAESLTGYIDEADGSHIAGWIWQPLHPSARLTVDLFDGNTRLARASANQFRADLLEAGIGDGRHAFLFLLDETPLPNRRHILHLRCSDSGIELPGSPIVIERGVAGATAPILFEAAAPYLSAAAGYAAAAVEPSGDPVFTESGEADDAEAIAEPSAANAGVATGKAVSRLSQAGKTRARAKRDADVESVFASHIDFADWTGIRGWIWDPQRPEKRIVLELADGDAVLATVLASEYRSDLEEAGIGDGRHGFSVPFAETLLPNARHVLHLRPVGSKVEVASFPLVLAREHAGIDVSALNFMHSNVAAESAGAAQAEDLAPLITNLVGMLDQALSQFHKLASRESATATSAAVRAADLGPETQALIRSIEMKYPRLTPDAAAAPRISIIIPVFNKFELTYNCVKSIIEQGAGVAFEIIVVDDCSRDETLLAGFAFGSGIGLIRNPENCGFIRSCNRGFEAARGDYVVFLNNDTEVKAGWLDELYRTLEEDPRIGVVGAKLLFADGRLQECGGIIWRLGDGWNWGRGEAADDPRYCYMRDADYVSGAALMIRRSLFDDVGRFDELFLPAYYEDTDLCFRVRQRGYRVVVQPAAEIVHFEGASSGTSTKSGVKRFQAVNHRKFFDRWKDTLAAHRFNGELPVLESERAVSQRALFIDATVPEPDQDAGSNAAVQHMLSLQRLGYKVTFVPGDNMARIDPYTAALQRRGIECLYHPFYLSVEDVFRKQPVPFDLVYLHRYSNAAKYAGMVRQYFPKAHILYNVADLHFLRMQRQADLENDAALRHEAEQLRRVEIGAMSFVDCVIVHSTAEAELLRQMAPDIAVRVIPWTVALRNVDKSAARQPAAGAGIAFVGGYRHPPNVDAAKWAAESIMPLLRREVPGIELLLVGSNMPPEVAALAAKDVVPLGFVPSLDSVFDRVQLTIAPLRYGAGLKGKVLESMAAGIPCVMTNVAAEGLDLPPELLSLVADDPKALSHRIAQLCRDDREYRRIVEGCKAHVAANYSQQRIDSLIREACGLD